MASGRVVIDPLDEARIQPSSVDVGLGRLGLLVHSTAGFIDPGFNGHITLELSNVASLPITLYPGMRIGQVSFLTMSTAADHPYGSGPLGSKYQGHKGADAEPLPRELPVELILLVPGSSARLLAVVPP